MGLLITLFVVFCTGPKFLGSAPGISYTNASELHCKKFSKSESIEVGRSAGNVVELQIRHNIQGEVEIRDGAPGSDLIRIEIDKTAATQTLLDNVVLNQTVFDKGYGTIYVLQVDYLESSSRIVTIIIGAVIAAIVFIALFSMLVWWYCTTEHQQQQQQQQLFQPASPTHQGGPVDATPQHGSGQFDTMVHGRYRGHRLIHRTCTLPTVSEVDAGLGDGSVTVPLPPPPRRANGGYTTQVNNSPNRIVSGGGGGGSGAMNRPAVVTLSLIAVISVVYAGCSIEPQVHIIVFLPPMLQLHGVTLYFNKIHDNAVVIDLWALKNATTLQVFDLIDASATVNAPCAADKLCPKAYSQGLAGCDALTRQCICQRGYQLKKGACVACTFGCPTGTFESSPCSTQGDRMCSACNECKGSMYEVRPCGGTGNRHCMHAAHPLLITGEETTPTFLEGLKVEASDNVFLENLHSTRNLETTYYVTDMTQASDFYWVRESGLQVNIGILDVNLIPEYEDVQHESDNKFMFDIPGESEDKIKFRQITLNKCRHPVPDHYSLTLEISRDRITAAHPFTCDSKNPELERCPSTYNDGELFLNRTLNAPCQNMGTFPEPLVPAVNSYVCTQHTQLLGEIFNQTYTPERGISFPPRRCRSASSRCDQCLTQTRCNTPDLFEQTCCKVDCYTLKDCKQAKTAHCESAPVECAMGDAYRYTIQPMFENIKNEFQCHIKRRNLKILYKMFYYIMLPERQFETPRVYKTVYAHDLEYQSHGQFIADYITVEHNSGLNLNDEFILLGKDLANSDRTNYSIYTLKNDDQFRKRKSPIHKMSHNVYVVPVQISKPFAYSTQNWLRGDFCEKDVAKFKSVQKLYNGDGQNVNVMVENVGSPLKYFLKASDNPPYIRFLAPGNTSVLPWYFRDKGPSLYTNESLKATLELMAGGRVWEIRLTGKLSDCPGYVGIVINNRLDLEELFRYDLLVFCPAYFNITFKIPNWGQEPDKTFDIHLEDSHRSYDIYLTHMLFEQHRMEKEAELASHREPRENNWAVISAILALGGICTITLLIGYVFLDCTKSHLIYTSHKINVYTATNGKASEDFCIAARNLSHGQVVFIVVYTVLRLIYSLLFTFTVFFAVLMLFLKSDIAQLEVFGRFQALKLNNSRELVRTISQYGQEELLRQAKLVTNMQGACSYYIEELFHTMQEQMDNVTANQHQQEMYSHHASIGYLLNQHVNHQLDSYWTDLDNFTAYYKSHFDRKIGPKFTRYNKYLRRIHDNDWFQFPQLLYNESLYSTHQPPQPPHRNLSGTEVDFASFLEVEEVEEVQWWPTRFWQRYAIRRPPYPRLPLPQANHQSPQCDTRADDESNNMTTQTPAVELDSSKYFAPHLPGRSLRGPVLKLEHVEQEYRFLTEADAAKYKEPRFSMDDFIDSMDTHILKIIFMVLDILLVIYRLSRTYMTATTLCRGFEESVNYKACKSASVHANMKESELQNLRNHAKHMNPDDRTAEHTYLRDDKEQIDSGLTDYSTTLDSQKSMLPNKANSNSMPSMVRNDIRVGKPYPTNHTEWRQESSFETCRSLVIQILQHSLIPKLLLAFVLLLLFHTCVVLTCLVFSVDTVAELDGFQAYLAGLDVQVNQTNWYLSQQAQHFNNITMKIYEQQMRSELLHLQGMLEYFNAEQGRLVKNYLSEACAVKAGLLGSRPCDVEVTPMKLTIPMLPCNFVPIQPQFYTGFNKRLYRSQVATDMAAYLTSARQVVLKTGYATLTVILLMIIIHLAGAVLFHFLKTRHKFPVQRVYILSSPPSCGAPANPPKDESDSEDHESGFKSYPSRVQMSPGKAHPKTEALMADFKYSETKV